MNCNAGYCEFSLAPPQLMLDNNVSGLPVVDAAGNIVGIVTEHDLLRRHANGSRSQISHAHDRAARAEAGMAELQRESILHRTRWPM
jgi:CBS-domain-containing membrane protein